MIDEARMEQSEYGLVPATDGWFTVSVRDSAWVNGESECLAIIEGEERPLQAWDFVHCPAGTEHIFVGAGGGPCVLFMAGAREHRGSAVYPRDEVALRHGAGVERETADSDEAYAPFSMYRPGPPERMPF